MPENRLREVEFPDQGHMRIQGEVRTPEYSYSLQISPCKTLLTVQPYTLEVTSNSIC